MNGRIDEIEAKLSVINAKLEEIVAKDASGITPPARKRGVIGNPAEGAGTDLSVPGAAGDPDSGYSSDPAIASYRQAMLLFEAGKDSEAILAFSAFLERYADHPLAGFAQLHLAESYLREKQPKLALQELTRVLTAYDRSAAVPEALEKIAATEDALQLPDQAARHRQMLLSLFPQSPAAAREASDSRAADHELHPEPRAVPSPSNEPKATSASPPASSGVGASGVAAQSLDSPPVTQPAHPDAAAASPSSGGGEGQRSASQDPGATLDSPPATAPAPQTGAPTP